MGDLCSVTILGRGPVGQTLATLAERRGHPVCLLPGRGEAPTGPIAPGLVLLTVPDDAIADVAARLAGSADLGGGHVVAHCSGALGSEILAPLRACGSSAGSMHPLQTFPDAEAGAACFVGTWCFIEGDPPAVAALEAFAKGLGARVERIATDAKPLYHAAAVLACNCWVPLIDAACRLAGRAGIAEGDFLPALRPLLEATVANVVDRGPGEALTGPVVRGDAETLAREVQAMAGAEPQAGNLYNAACLWTLDLAVRAGRLDPQAARAVRAALGEHA